MTAGQLIRRHRERLGLAQNRLARLSGINVGTINRLERDQRMPSCPEQVLTIAASLSLGPGDTDRLLVASGMVPVERRRATRRRWAKWRASK